MSKNNNLAITSFRYNFSKEVFINAYKKREKEIESLRKYDRGEKIIIPINIKNIT